MGLFGSIAGGNTANTQTTVNQQASSQYGNVIGAASRGQNNTYGLGTGATIGSNFGSQLKNVGNNAGNIIKLNNQIGKLQTTLARQQANLGKFKTGSPGYNNVSKNIANTQGRLSSAQNSLKAISNLSINASTNLTINPSLDTGLAQLSSAFANALSANAAFNLAPGNPTSTNSVINQGSGNRSTDISPTTAIGNTSNIPSVDSGGAVPGGLAPTGPQATESPTIAGMDTTQLLVIAAGIGLVVLIARRF